MVSLIHPLRSSDHSGIQLELKINSATKKHQPAQVWCYSCGDYVKMKHMIESLDLNDFLSTDINASLTLWDLFEFYVRVRRQRGTQAPISEQSRTFWDSWHLWEARIFLHAIKATPENQCICVWYTYTKRNFTVGDAMFFKGLSDKTTSYITSQPKISSFVLSI